MGIIGNRFVSDFSFEVSIFFGCQFGDCRRNWPPVAGVKPATGV
jgi:hypothetical protein